MYLSCNIVILAYRRIKNPRNIGSLCLIRVLLIPTSKIWSFSSFRNLKNLLLKKPIRMRTFQIFCGRMSTTVHCLITRSFPSQRFPINFTVSATTITHIFEKKTIFPKQAFVEKYLNSKLNF